MKPLDSPETFLFSLAGIGALIGIGKLLDSPVPITPRLIAARAVVTAGIGMAAGSVLLLVPAADPLVLYGLAAGLSSLGTSGFEYVMRRRLGGGDGGPSE